MRISSALVALVGATAGVATGVTSYQSSAEVPPPAYDDGPVLAVGQPLPAAPPQVKHAPADCVAPAVLQGGACVTTVTKTVPAPAPKADPQPAAEAPAAAPAAPAQAPAAPAPEPAADAPAQWTGAAGSVVVQCNGGAISLQAATPANGYEVEVDEDGPEEVKVEFESEETDAEVEAICAGGTAQLHADEDD
jgi:hypothetical protein